MAIFSGFRGVARRARCLRTLSIGATLALAGCFIDANDDGRLVVACLGDSNTAADGSAVPRWCERVAASLSSLPAVSRDGGRRAFLPVEFVNPSAPGATVCNPGYAFEWALPQLERAIAAGADLMLIALGTNDIAAHFRSPEEVVECHRAIARRLPPGVAFLVALTPPGYADHAWFTPAADELAHGLREEFGGHVIDFATGFSIDLFEGDGLHANDAGHALRAARARQALAWAALGGAWLPRLAAATSAVTLPRLTATSGSTSSRATSSTGS